MHDLIPKFLALTLALLACAFGLMVLAAYVFQRSIMYFPAPAEGPPEAGGPPIQVVRLDTSDGERLVAWFLPPRGDKPVILQFGGNADGLGLQRDRWRRLDDAGVGFLAIAYRGYSGSTGKPTERGLHEDARTGYRWLAARYPAERIVIHGFSLGTGVAVRLAAEQPARALVLEAPFTAAVDVAGSRAPYLPVKLLMRDPYLSRDWIGKVTEPVLIAHGDRDTVIPFASGRRLYELANQPKVFVRMAGSDHSTLVRDGVYDHIWKFLGVDATAAPP